LNSKGIEGIQLEERKGRKRERRMKEDKIEVILD
jgi:hypothetical protein